MLPVAIALLLAAPEAPRSGPDLEWLATCSDTAWVEDVRNWSNYSFDRHVILRDLDRSGAVKQRVDRHFRLTPDDGGFDERLLSENGRTATTAEIREFRRKRNFTRNYRGAPSLEFDNPLGEDLVLMPILRDQEHRLVGREVIDGVACYRTVFDASTPPSRASSQSQLKNAMRGSICVTTEGCHVVEMKLSTVRPVQQGLATIDHMRVTIEGGPIEEGWVPHLIEAEFDFVLLGRHLRRITTYEYSNFRPFPD